MDECVYIYIPKTLLATYIVCVCRYCGIAELLVYVSMCCWEPTVCMHRSMCSVKVVLFYRGSQSHTPCDYVVEIDSIENHIHRNLMYLLASEHCNCSLTVRHVLSGVLMQGQPGGVCRPADPPRSGECYQSGRRRLSYSAGGWRAHQLSL